MTATRSAGEAVRASTIHGPVVGSWREGTARFLGIPYARPPVGDLRFSEPVPPEPWTTPKDATRYGPTAQRRPYAEVTTIPEPTIPGADVLNLNVFTPRPEHGAALPVLVWLHGGGFAAGCSASPWYDGAAFCRDGVVVVSIGYRLGIEGFLHLDDAPDNRGVLDWLAALRWVRDNIAHFGGDPHKVTIAGQSAGAGAVQTLFATPAARGLFRAGIALSGAIMQPQRRATGLAVAELFARRTGIAATAAALRDRSDADLLALEDRLKAPGPERDTLPRLLLAPFADGTLVPEPVPDAFTTGTAAAVPLLLGFTEHEFTAHAARVAAGATLEAARGMLLGLGLEPATYLTLHNGQSPAEIIGQAVTDATFHLPALAIGEARAWQDRPTWLYQFSWGSPRQAGRAVHCLDVPFAFDLLHAEGVARVAGPTPPQRLADAVHGALAAFVRDLDPGARWPRYTTAGRPMMVWDTEPRVVHDPLAAERTLLGSTARE